MSKIIDLYKRFTICRKQGHRWIEVIKSTPFDTFLLPNFYCKTCHKEVSYFEAHYDVKREIIKELERNV